MSTWVTEIIPPELLHPDRAEAFVRFVRFHVPVPEDRKQLVISWCDYVGVPLTHNLVNLAGAT